MFESNMRYWIISIIIIILLLLTIALNIYIYYNPRIIEQDNDIVLEKEVEEPDIQEEELISYYVDIKGAVVNPGVYQVNKGTIINDVINMAGGLNKDASTKYLNLSKETSNEMVIYIYTNKELVEEPKVIKETCNCKNEIIKDCVNNKASVIEIGNTNKEENNESSNSISNGKVNINTATLEELMNLNGIGESKAQAIIEYRNTNGNFNSIEDIKNVSGIGDSAFEKIKDYITV